MKVLVIARGFPTAQEPANGNFEYEQALALSKEGVEVVIAYIDRRTCSLHSRKTGLLLQQNNPIRVYGGYMKPVVSFRYFPIISTLIYKRRFIRLFQSIIKIEGYFDVIHCHYLFNLPQALAIGKRNRIPVVETEHWSDLKKKPLPFYVKYLSRYYNAADKIVTVSLALNATLFNLFKINSSTIYNMVSDDYFCQREPSLNFHGAKIQFVSIGSLIHRKGFDLLIEAFGRLTVPTDRWHLTIIGSGPDHDYIEGLIKEKKLENNITLAGRKNKEEIRFIFQTSDVFVLPSRSETFGVVYIEAMACGLPVIATRCGGPEEFVTQENGVLIDVEDLEGLTVAVANMLDNCRNYSAERIKMLCQEQFSSQVIAQQYIKVYSEVIIKD